MTKHEPNTVTLRDVTEVDLPILYEQQLDLQATVMATFPAEVTSVHFINQKQEKQ